MSKQIKVILFDNDGVLAHTEELFFEINSQCFREIDIPYTRQDFENHTFITNLGTTGFMKTLNCTDEKIESFRVKRNLLWQKAITKESVIDPAAEDVLQVLRASYKIGIVTNTDRENFNKTYHDSEVLQLADFIINREDYLHGKPEPDSYLKALEVAGAPSDEAVVIEDSPRGIAAAKAAHLTVIAIPNPVIKNLDISQADYRIESLTELPELLQQIV
jgi:HAD superfamily hydrolase (TIGR01509 family)